MIKAVFFDIDDTLFHFSGVHPHGMKAITNYLQETNNVSKESLNQALFQAQKIIGERIGYSAAAFHNRQIRFQNALEILGIPIYPYATRMYELYWNTIIEEAVPEPGICQLLKSLKEKGIYLGIGSDMTSYIQNKKLEKLGIAQYFDSVVTSEEAGIDKPDSGVFRLCISKAGYRPKECLFIGDHVEKDYKGAKAAGMQALCYAKYSGGVKADERANIFSYEQVLDTILRNA